jgi:hypothetical protein
MQFSGTGKQGRPVLDSDNKKAQFLGASSDQTAQYHGNRADHLDTLISVYNQGVQAQLNYVICEFTYLSKNVANLIRVHHHEAFHDFERRKNTGAIPVDPTNFHACLAGSIVMCGSTQANNAGARQVEEKLVNLSVILDRSSSALIEADEISAAYSYHCKIYISMPLRTWS